MAFDRAWRAGDVDGLMDLMHPEPRYAASLGPGPGEVFEGAAAVRRAFERVIMVEAESAGGTVAPELREDDIWIDGSRALTRWQYASVGHGGQRVHVPGVDLWEFDGVRIKSKDAYRKASAQ